MDDALLRDANLQSSAELIRNAENARSRFDHDYSLFRAMHVHADALRTRLDLVDVSAKPNAVVDVKLNDMTLNYGDPDLLIAVLDAQRRFYSKHRALLTPAETARIATAPGVLSFRIIVQSGN